VAAQRAQPGGETRSHLTKWRHVALIGGALMLGAGLMTPADAAPGSPPGNNGTVKVNGGDISGPGNDPHVGCAFYIDFYNYEANLPVEMVFETQPPTGNSVIHTEVGILDDDDASGADAAGLDGHFEIDLSAALSGIEPHPVQGHHVKLTVTVDDGNTQGAQSKHKTFWVEGCGTTSTTGDTTPSTEGTTPSTEGTTPSTEGTTPSTEGTTPTSDAEPTPPSGVGGAGGPSSTPSSTAEAGAVAPQVASAPLARTGNDLRLAWVGGLTLGMGFALEILAQRRRAAQRV
jgi:hypothetical protein